MDPEIPDVYLLIHTEDTGVSIKKGVLKQEKYLYPTWDLVIQIMLLIPI